MEKIQIVVLSRDRPEYLKEAIDSILMQTQNTFELIVSDNSEGGEVLHMLSKNYRAGDFNIIRRNPPLSSKEHFQAIISELTAEYAVLFHDDDIMHPDYVKSMCKFLLKRKGVSAVGCGAFEFESAHDLHGVDLTRSHNPLQRFSDKKDFLSRYLPGNGKIAPFPSYMYKTEKLQRIKFSSLSSGKYSDVVLLSSLLDYGEIFWLPDVLIFYRRHNANDSNLQNIAGLIELSNYMSKNGLQKSQDSMLLFRFSFWLNWFATEKISNVFSWRNRVVFKFLLLSFFRLLNKKILWTAALKKTKK